MNIKNIIALFLLCSIVTAPLMSMDNQTFKEAQNAISLTIKKKYDNYKRNVYEHELLNKFKKIERDYDFTLKGVKEDIKNIKNKLDNNIYVAPEVIDTYSLLENNCEDLILFNSHTIDVGMQKILEQSFDKQQKIMDVIACAHYLHSPFLPKIIEYAVHTHRIPKDILEMQDTTLQSLTDLNELREKFAQEKQNEPFNLESLNEIAPTELLTTWSNYIDSSEFDPIINEIKTGQYALEEKYHTKLLTKTIDTMTQDPEWWAWLISWFSNTQENNFKKLFAQLKHHFATTSLSNKITILTTLYEIQNMLSQKANHVRFDQGRSLVNLATGLLALGSTCWLGGMVIMAYVLGRLPEAETAVFITMLAGIGCIIAPLCILHHSSNPDTLADQLENRKKPVDNLIKEFKEWIKIEYKTN